MARLSSEDAIRKRVNEISFIPDALWDLVSENVKVRHLAKGEFLQRSDTPVTHGWLVLSGLVRSYTESIDGDEITMGFVAEGELTCVYPTFLKGELSKDNLQTLEDTTCAELDLRILTSLIGQHMELNTFMRRVTESQLIGVYERTFNLMHFSAPERYEAFKQTRSKIFARLTQKHIASYLGISRETLNRIIKDSKL